MSAITECFQSLTREQKCALIPFITAGDPDLQTTAEALQALDRNGADLIELGIPYSDPLADGPVIQAAANRALQRGTNLDRVLEMLATVTPTLKAPIIAFSYYNPILNRGIDLFLSQLAAVGVAGLIIPDLPLEEANTVLEPAKTHGIDVTLLVAPTSSQERIAAIAKASSGFIYLVSVTGVTGMRSQTEMRVSDLIIQIRNHTDKPIGVGFGVSRPEHARQLRDWGADGVIVGSAIVDRLASNPPSQGIEAIGQFCHSLKQAIA